MSMAEHGADVWRDGVRLPLLDFSSNVNPLAPPKGLLKEAHHLIRLAYDYPEPESSSLQRFLAEYHDVQPAQVLPTNGANEAIYLATAKAPPGVALIIAPTYSEYQRAAEGFGHKVTYVRLRHPFEVKASRIILPEHTSMIYLCNPNNPTGTITPKADILALHEKAKAMGAILLVDEVHMDLAENEEDSVIKEVDDHMIVIRSPAKLLGIPGLRVGYAVSSANRIASIASIRPTWDVNVIASELVKHWMKRDYQEESRHYVSKERKRIVNRLLRMGFTVYPSKTNFLLLRKPGINSAKLKMRLMERGYLIRDASSFEGLDHTYIRIGIMRARQNDELLNALKAFFGEAKPHETQGRS